jgi:hypothetical protein
MASEDIVLASIRAYTGRWLTRATWRETYGPSPPDVPRSLLLRQTPLIAVTTVAVSDGTLVEGDDYLIDWNRARIDVGYYAWCWSGLPNTVVVTYDAGFDPLPADLQDVIDSATAALSAEVADGGALVGISSMDLPDVGSVRFDVNAGGGAVAGASLLPVLQPYAAVLSRYRDTSLLWMQRENRRVELIAEAPP